MMIFLQKQNEGEEEETVENAERGGMLGDAYKGLNNISKLV